MSRATIFFVFAFSLAVSAQTMAPFVPQNASPASVWAFDRNLLWGRTDAWEGSPDFFCRQSESHSNVIHPLSDGSPKCYAKGMVLGDIGDAPDLILRRAGPDGAAYNARPQVVGGGTSLGTLYGGGQAFRHRGSTNVEYLDGHTGISESAAAGPLATQNLLDQVMGYPANGFLSEDDRAYDPR